MARAQSPSGGDNLVETCASDDSQSFGGSSACSMVAMAIRQAVVVIKMVACSHGGQLLVADKDVAQMESLRLLVSLENLSLVVGSL